MNDKDIRVYQTPGCTCNGYNQATADAKAYRKAALNLACAVVCAAGHCPVGFGFARQYCPERTSDTYCHRAIIEMEKTGLWTDSPAIGSA